MAEIRIDKLLRSKRRTIGIEITQEAKLIVRAPGHVSREYLESIILKKRNWILKKQKFFQQRKSEYPARKFIEGESFYFLGNTFCLKIIAEGVIRLTECLEFPECLLVRARENLIQWYKARAYEKIKERIDWYSKITDLPYASIKISNSRKRLGSCSFKGRLNFSWRLIMAPLAIIDYVVVHELTHLEELNHSSRFWNKVKAVLPDYKNQEARLKNNQWFSSLDQE